MDRSAPLPDVIRTEEELDELMTRPSAELVSFVTTLRGPLLVLGAGGKMGPSLAARVKRASEAARVDLRVIAVSRFSDGAAREWLGRWGVETLSADLFDRDAVAGLPDAPDVIYLVGSKFGTTANPSRTWAVNTLVPERVAERYARSRVVALSTGNVYPLVSVRSNGSVESDPLTPLGEYPNAAVARERVFEFFSRENGTPVVLVRLNYAVDLRYGVLVDVARRVHAGEPVDVTTGYLNCVWQGDANDMIVRGLALAETPPRPLNLTGAEKLSVRGLAEEFGRRFDLPVRVSGAEAETALLSDSTRARRLLGEPATPIGTVVRWTAEWVRRGGRLWDKPTHFEVRDGMF